ncbi:MAG: 1-(5-phosphoribosyl)-5-[(5-phosphoribosylamino)methylideneamino]imidazole-4-carboxamide isomerase [Bacteroidales bacterium]|nr:1-(5-phosphoribosyl)-5-[(5-phosphoribosylamino)methylideneamino]imidazole-4-carboxamide isomerase [Bacteroidales bacterium]
MIEILPAIDIIDGKCVRLTKGDYNTVKRYDADPADMVKRYVDHGFCRVHTVDLDGARCSAPCNLRALERMASVNGAEIEWGGGLKSQQALDDSLNAGASFLVVGSLAVKTPDLFTEWLQRYGADRMVLGADADSDGRVAVNGWEEKSELTLENLIDRFIPAGLTQVITTDISCDGMLQGPSFKLYERLMKEYPAIIFTASGGISSLADIERLATDGVPRVIVGKAIYENRVSLTELEKLVEGC